jgi:hypothetical protein
MRIMLIALDSGAWRQIGRTRLLDRPLSCLTTIRGGQCVHER